MALWRLCGVSLKGHGAYQVGVEDPLDGIKPEKHNPHGRHDLDESGRQAFVEARDAFSFDNIFYRLSDSCVYLNGDMKLSLGIAYLILVILCNKLSTEYVQRVSDACGNKASGCAR